MEICIEAEYVRKNIMYISKKTISKKKSEIVGHTG
jgi:hypothetical protein